jgi:hypothetical protein
MKKNRLFFLILFISSLYNTSLAQISADDDRIVIIPYLPEQVFDLSKTVSTNLYTKMAGAITKNGMSGEGLHNRFIMSAVLNVLQKDVTATAPPMHVIDFELSLFVGDGVDGVLFASTSKSMKGVGRNETAAYIMALNNLDVNSKEIKNLIEQGKSRIVQYYNDKCEIIIRESKTKANQDQFDEAIYALLEIPSVVSDCYQKAMDEAVRIHKLKLEKECQTNISFARGEMMQGNWSAAIQTISGYTPDLSCYSEVSKLLDQIETERCSVEIGKASAAWSARDVNNAAYHLARVSASSSCKSQADGLMRQISSAIDAQAKREWDLAYEKYNRDQVIREENSRLNREISRREMSFKEKQGVELRKMEIQAARDVGVAYGNNQPKSVTYNIRNWW